MSQKLRKNITFNEFFQEFFFLKGQVLSYMDPYYKKLDLHFGEYKEEDGQKSSDYVLYISGVWKILDSGKMKIDESFAEEKIADFFSSQLGSHVDSVKLSEDSEELHIELSTGLLFSVQGDKVGHWIELQKRNGDLIYSPSQGRYVYKVIL